jgi:hypothetical protein
MNLTNSSCRKSSRRVRHKGAELPSVTKEFLARFFAHRLRARTFGIIGPQPGFMSLKLSTQVSWSNLTGGTVMRALFSNLTPADFSGRSKKELRTVKRQQVHELFDEIQIAIYNNDRERVDLLMVKLALATTNPRHMN